MASVVIGTAVSLGVSALSRALTPTQYVYNQKEEGKIDNLSVRKTGMGWSLNRIYGKDIVRGCPIFWALPKRQETATTSDTQASGGGKGGGTVTTTETTTYSYYGTFAIAIADGPCAEIKQIIFNDEIWYNAEGETSGTAQNNAYNLANHLEIYLGTSNQSASPTIASYSDPTKVKFPYLVYLVIKDLPLASFGNELPSTIDVVIQGTENNLNTVLLDIGNRVGLTPNIDLIAGTLGNITVIGATLKQDGNSVKSLADELIQYHFVTMFTDENGALNFVRQENNDAAIAIDYEDLGAVSYGSESVSPYEETIANIQDLPSEVSLSFQNVNDLFSGYTSAWVNQSVAHFLPRSISSGLVLTPDLGDTFCYKYLDKLWFEKNRLKISLLPEKVIGLNVRDKLSFPLADGENPVTCQIVGLQIGADYRGEIDLVFYEGEIYSSVPSIPRYTSIVYDGNVIQLQPNITNPPIIYNGNTLLVEDTDYTVDYEIGEVALIGISNGSNINITYESEANDSVAPPNPNDELPFYGEPIVTILDINRVSPLDSPCLYLAIEPDPIYNSFGFTSIYASINDLAYIQSSSFVSASTIGTLQDNLPLVSGLDTTSTVTIELDRGTLSNLTTNEFDNDQQIILIGNEQIVVKNANLTGTLTYDVSHLKRGHNGTTPSSHSIGAKVYVLKGSGQIAKLPITKDLIGATIDIKAVPVGNSLENVTLISSATIAGNYYKGILEISGFSPTQGRIGDEIKIYGTGFSNATSASINGVYVTSFAIVSDTCITGIVGNTTTTGKVSVTSYGGTGESLTDFVIITDIGNGASVDSMIQISWFY